MRAEHFFRTFVDRREMAYNITGQGMVLARAGI
jgi:hypothetical protein